MLYMQHPPSTLRVCKCLDYSEWFPAYFIMETFHSIDGPRARIADGTYKTEKEARAKLREFQRLVKDKDLQSRKPNGTL